ncbi:uncharacterized protein A4U43_C10F2200 [Asparagus officinalis]|uniref:5' exonuclease Apollo n=1 Tax=Asparagus officinalis TaxID=4686 RepID=A0A5P1E0I8_ASPOF|nr:uncharacterized protein A4U43_C10F2200 [Asparagus officinalis]
MYLFRGEFGCILHTGDFRWESGRERSQLGKRTLIDALDGDSIDVLYLDNTYCNPSFSFPSREVAAQQVIEIIARHPDHEVVIGIDTLGKEDLLLQIAEALNTKIWVWPERLRTMHLLGFFDVFTTKTCLTRVRAVPRHNVTLDTLEALNTLHPTIGIMPSGLPWMRLLSKNQGSYESQRNANNLAEKQYLYSVPYSEHSCFSEIQEFIKIVRPSTVTGIVSSSFCYNDPRWYFRRLCGATHLSFKPSCHVKTETSGKIEAKQSGSTPQSTNKLKADIRVKMKFARLSVRRSRVCILRRKRIGVKLAEAVINHNSDFIAEIT